MKTRTRLRFHLTEADYLAAQRDYQGVCLSCGALRDTVEPDAEGYKCDNCGELKVMGVEQALTSGAIEIQDDDDESGIEPW